MDIKNTTLNNCNVEQLLLQIRASFLDELPERCAAMEALVLQLAQAGNKEDFNALYREIHSLKGGAGTHGIPVITTICHYFEDHINVLTTSFGHISDEFTATCLRYLDFIERAISITSNDNPDFGALEEDLKQFHNVAIKGKSTVLIIESSISMTEIYRQALRDSSVDLSFSGDGLKGLERLLYESFDCVIVGRTLKTLNAQALISALRASDSSNKNIKIIMLSSSGKLDFPSSSKPDLLIKRGPKMADSLVYAIAKLL